MIPIELTADSIEHLGSDYYHILVRIDLCCKRKQNGASQIFPPSFKPRLLAQLSLLFQIIS